MDIHLGAAHIYALNPSLDFATAQQQATDKRLTVVAGGLGAVFSRPKPEEVELTYAETRYEAFWHLVCTVRYEFERKKDYHVAVTGNEVRKVTLLGQEFEVAAPAPAPGGRAPGGPAVICPRPAPASANSSASSSTTPTPTHARSPASSRSTARRWPSGWLRPPAPFAAGRERTATAATASPPRPPISPRWMTWPRSWPRPYPRLSPPTRPMTPPRCCWPAAPSPARDTPARPGAPAPSHCRPTSRTAAWPPWPSRSRSASPPSAAPPRP